MRKFEKISFEQFKKDVTIETGYTLKAPLFISEGEEIVITTRDGKYFSRG